jgi:hypothetical protein
LSHTRPWGAKQRGKIEETPLPGKESRRNTPMARVELNTPAPTFSLEDFRGRNVALPSLLAKGPVVLVFNRGFT